MIGYWVLAFMVGYTALLIYLGQVSRKKITGGESYFSGGSSFGVLYIVGSVSAFWGAATFISVLETAYTKGISAVWYGVATMIMVAMIGFVLVPKYKSIGMVTFSGVLGDQYGNTVRAISSLIIGITFPMFSIATVVGASSVLTVALHWPIWLSVTVTSLIILAYVLLGGMFAVGITQLLNLATMYLGLVLALVIVAVNTGFDKLATLPASYSAPFTVGTGTILVWIFNFLTNAVIAQAVIQMIMACKDAKTGRKGTGIAILGIIPLTVIPAILGMATALAVPDVKGGLIAFAQYILQAAPAPVAALVFLGVWAAALAYAGPCQFSGGTSLGKDFFQSINENASNEQLVRYGGYATALLTGVLIVYGFMRAEQAAWWNIFAFNLRNSAVFAPTIAALVWPVASRRATIMTMILGASAGFTWYYLGNFSPAAFYMKVHPMWIGMSVGILTLVLVSIVENRKKISISFEKNSGFGFLCLALTLLCAYLTAAYTSVLQVTGLLGNLIFLATMGLFTVAIIFVHFKKEDAPVRSSA
ncbi:sodium-solute symporter, putative [Desulfocucumis palustris]|uniref:Sodium-solute symporter, putative n=1 Tax=Desulfocucumis palustris TaxID=1898651 RepID=A0A2L2XCD6_9FIRM|nr:sodium:solute symporter family protein [Desulfocucumis palustris]GBF33664.1 sodium-solute symporter, putative [Desulfocucumis palustris]